MKTADMSLVDYWFNLLNVCLHLVHLTIIFFFIFGLLFETMRLAHFVLSLFILFSWFGLGAYFGFGYCVVTDIQWRVKRRLKHDLPTELYVKYMIDKVTGLNTDATTIDSMTTYIFFGLFAISAVMFLTAYSSYS